MRRVLSERRLKCRITPWRVVFYRHAPSRRRGTNKSITDKIEGCNRIFNKRSILSEVTREGTKRDFTSPFLQENIVICGVGEKYLKWSILTHK